MGIMAIRKIKSFVVVCDYCATEISSKVESYEKARTIGREAETGEQTVVSGYSNIGVTKVPIHTCSACLLKKVEERDNECEKEKN